MSNLICLTPRLSDVLSCLMRYEALGVRLQPEASNDACGLRRAGVGRRSTQPHDPLRLRSTEDCDADAIRLSVGTHQVAKPLQDINITGKKDFR